MAATFSASRRGSSVTETVDVLTSRLAPDRPSSEGQRSMTIDRMPGSRTFESASERLARITNRNGGPFEKRPSTIQSALEAGSWRSRQQLPTATGSSSKSTISDGDQLSGAQGVVQGFVAPGQLDYAHSYAYHRGNGQYSRLVPVDELPYDIQGIPRTQGPQGLIIVPEPPHLSHIRTSSQNTFSAPQPPATTPPSRDLIQGRIDQIVACSPAKREKVYCDKWVHTGTCAFAQVGCKFKHEMPLDKLTQHQLGLFQGLPDWYKRDQAVEFHSSRRGESAILRTPPNPSSSHASFISASTSALYPSAAPTRFTAPPTTGIFSARPAPPPKPYFGNFGPVSRFGQPQELSSLGGGVPLLGSNPYAMLGEWEREAEEQ